MYGIDKTKLTDETKFRLYEIKNIENDFINEINEQKLYSKKLNRYVTSARTKGISIISFTTAIEAPVGIARASFSLIFSLTTGIIKKLLNITINKKKKLDQILVLAESKFNSIENLMSQALGDLDIIHKKFILILKERGRYEKMKYNLISKNEKKKQEIVKLNNI